MKGKKGILGIFWNISTIQLEIEKNVLVIYAQIGKNILNDSLIELNKLTSVKVWTWFF